MRSDRRHTIDPTFSIKFCQRISVPTLCKCRAAPAICSSRDLPPDRPYSNSFTQPSALCSCEPSRWPCSVAPAGAHVRVQAWRMTDALPRREHLQKQALRKAPPRTRHGSVCASQVRFRAPERCLLCIATPCRHDEAMSACATHACRCFASKHACSSWQACIARRTSTRASPALATSPLARCKEGLTALRCTSTALTDTALSNALKSCFSALQIPSPAVHTLTRARCSRPQQAFCG